MKFILLISLFAFFPPTKTEKVTIETNACCEMSKYLVEKGLRKVEGIKRAEVDLTTKKVNVKYDPAVIDVATIRQAVAATGFSADEVPARPKAYDALPNCCKGDGTACKKKG